jgi:hypothetical protein
MTEPATCEPPPAHRDERARLVEYLFGPEYRRLLHRAIASRLATTSAHEAKHRKALALFEAAFPDSRI